MHVIVVDMKMYARSAGTMNIGVWGMHWQASWVAFMRLLCQHNFGNNRSIIS